MTLEELNRELISNEEKLLVSLQNFKNAKAEYRKAKITSISNKLLTPFRKFKINMDIAKYDAMMDKIEKQKVKEIARAEKLQQKEDKKIKKEAKADFKAAIREKQKDTVISFVNDKTFEAYKRMSEIKEFGYSIVSSSSSSLINVKNSIISKVKANTLIDITINNAIDNLKLKYATNKYNKAVEQQRLEKEKARIDRLDQIIQYEQKLKEERKSSDVPFSSIKEKIQKAKRQNNYMGRATNKAVVYIKSNYDNISRKVNNKILDAKINASVNTYFVIGKVSKVKSGMITAFNNQIETIKENVTDRIDTFKANMDQRKDMIATLREEEARKRAIKRVQLENLKQATEAINNGIYDNSVLFDQNYKTL